jgi:hypothetical protein
MIPKLLLPYLNASISSDSVRPEDLLKSIESFSILCSLRILKISPVMKVLKSVTCSSFTKICLECVPGKTNTICSCSCTETSFILIKSDQLGFLPSHHILITFQSRNQYKICAGAVKIFKYLN